MQLFATLTLLSLTALGGAPGPAARPNGPQDKAPRSQTPDAKNAAKWADFIRPSSEELKYEAIGWRNQFWPAVQEAKELGRPILLWTMNGHPLGCT